MYRPMLEEVRVAMVAQDGSQPGDPHRAARAVISAMAQEPPPLRLVLGGDGFDTAITMLEHALTDIRRNEGLSRGAGFPAAT